MDISINKKCKATDPTIPDNQGDIFVQLVLSLVLGSSALLGFCFLRPRWKGLYAARKRQSHAASVLPELPDSFFGWMPVLYQVTEQEVLASAGLDAYVFLAFFRMSIKLFSIMFVITCAILVPINKYFYWLPTFNEPNNPNQPPPAYSLMEFRSGILEDDGVDVPDPSYLWAYLVFTYFFTGLVLYFMTTETQRIIKIRQDYLGSQSTITDRTFRLSGVPAELRSEEKIKELLEKLEIGKVESVTICRNWKKLDELMKKRNYTLRQLETAWTVHLGRSKSKAVGLAESHHNGTPEEDEESNNREADTLLGQSHVTSYENPRPTTRIWYGFLGLQSRKVDAIDYFEEQLRNLDDKIVSARKKEYTPTPLAFVTMDSIPACQMAVQALLDPSPMRLMAKLAPAPSDIVWQNTYLPRSSRMARSWAITIFIIVLTVFWLIPVALLAGLLDLCSISQVWPQLATFLGRHHVLRSLVQTGLPTLVVSLLNISVPFLYDYLANMQGMVSQGDMELSVVSKNFFFTFFNVFLVFTAFGTVSQIWSTLEGSLKDTTYLAYQLAGKVQNLAVFYTNFILLQGLGLIPLRLLEVGNVALYPIMKMVSKTPRDYAKLVQPPVFSYGFYLPSAILVHILCIVYSIQPAGYMVLFFGIIYFITSYYTYKYQLLYAMDHPQHATGKAWPLICYRILIGLGVFQLVMAGIIALLKNFAAAGAVVPLIPFTIWYSYFYARTFEPLMKFIALRSIRRESDTDINIAGEDIGINRPPGYHRRASTTIDEAREEGLVFINPTLTVPLEKLWIDNKDSEIIEDGSSPDLLREESASSSLSLGDTHIWRDSGEENEAVNKTSSQIFLSRGVAGADSEPPSPHATSPPLVASIYESESTHIMTVGDAATRTASSGLNEDLSSSDINETEVSRLIAHTTKANSSSPSHIADSGSGKKEKKPVSAFPIQKPIQDGVSEGSNGKGKEIDRGRSSEQGPRYPNPLSRAESWSRMKDAAIEIDVRPIEKRNISRSSTFFDDPNDPCGALDDYLLEPCPHDSICDSMSEVLNTALHEKDALFRSHRSSTWSSSYSIPIPPASPPARAILTAFNECRPLFPAPTLPADSLSHGRPNISQLETLADETFVTSHTTAVTPLITSSLFPHNIPLLTSRFGTQFPTEILQQVYYNLSPVDFNAARHTCRLWYINSLNGKLLDTMFRRGGFSSSCMKNDSVDISGSLKTSNRTEWLMSKRISRECALGPDWTGNGMDDGEGDLIAKSSKKSSFVQISWTDFTELAVHYPGPNSAGTIFTVSSCGRFLMAANGCLVYVYELNRRPSDVTKTSPGHLSPVTSIICPRRVLASSMDTSSHRYAIGILMEGRMGLVCDISALNSSTMQPSRSNNSQLSKGSEKSRLQHQTAVQFRELPFVFPGTALSQQDPTSVEEDCWQDLIQDDMPEKLCTAGPSSRHASLLRSYISNPEDLLRLSPGELEISNALMPVETGSRSLYRHLCSDDDPPRSVAICPQRRCVAFGCSSGIELHWVDALTGQDLNRWFPLTAPSDFLYFLPPRKCVDSAKKLRLISSAAKPGERPAIAHRSFGVRPRSSPFWERFGMEDIDNNVESDAHGILTGLRVDARRSVLSGRMDTSDHFKAIPLSDGYHILFTDPATGILCLGSDAPIGGPTKLLRKIWFQGPDGMGSPIQYAGGSDLSLGVRVVAAFGSGPKQSIWIFSVPSDIFAANQGDQTVYPWSTWANPNPSQETKYNEWVNWWPEDGLQGLLNHVHAPVPGILPRTIWPVKIRGQMIGYCDSLVDLAIDSGPSMTIWAFSQTGSALVWKLDDGSFDSIKKILIMRDGTVREEDSDGNIEMPDLPTTRPVESIGAEISPHTDSFDGSASFMLTSDIDVIIQTHKERVKNDHSEYYDVDGDIIMENISGSMHYDADGDVLMEDFFSNPNTGAPGSQSWEDLVLEQFGGEVWYHREEYLRQNFRSPTLSFAEELTGLVRIDIEIQ